MAHDTHQIVQRNKYTRNGEKPRIREDDRESEDLESTTVQIPTKSIRTLKRRRSCDANDVVTPSKSLFNQYLELSDVPNWFHAIIETDQFQKNDQFLSVGIERSICKQFSGDGYLPYLLLRECEICWVLKHIGFPRCGDGYWNNR